MGNDSKQVEWSIAEAMKEGAKRVVMDLRALDALTFFQGGSQCATRS
jgi:hypothetical protein